MDSPRRAKEGRRFRARSRDGAIGKNSLWTPPSTGWTRQNVPVEVLPLERGDGVCGSARRASRGWSGWRIQKSLLRDPVETPRKRPIALSEATVVTYASLNQARHIYWVYALQESAIPPERPCNPSGPARTDSPTLPQSPTSGALGIRQTSEPPQLPELLLIESVRYPVRSMVNRPFTNPISVTWKRRTILKFVCVCHQGRVSAVARPQRNNSGATRSRTGRFWRASKFRAVAAFFFRAIKSLVGEAQ